MNQQEQMRLVILHSLMELDGGGKRRDVLKHINQQQYWHKNDNNDGHPNTRKEATWRNNFSYERHHLVEEGFMQNDTQGIWEITKSGKNHFFALAEKAKNLESEDVALFTKSLHRRLLGYEICSEEAADQLLLELIIESPEATVPAPVDKPLPKGTVSNRKGNIYLRNPIISNAALNRAGHLCELDKNHASFVRRNSVNLYMEPHHLIPMSMTEHFGVSLDREQNIFSLCSNCHNQIHYGLRDDVKELVSRLFSSRKNEICAILGRDISLDDIYGIYSVL